MSTKTLWVILGLVFIILIGWALWASNPSTSTLLPASTATGPTSAATAGTPASGDVTVLYTNQGFSPSTVTIEQGASVTWINQSSEELWVATDPHPEHTGYDGTTRQVHCAANYAGPVPFDECTSIPSGGSYTFTFGQIGTWGYHNHDDASVKGTVIVLAPSENVSATSSASVNI